jgi:hypothetical protein
MKSDSFLDLKKEVLEIMDRYPHLSPDNAFIAWFLRAFVTQNEEEAIAAVKGGAGDKSTDGVYIDDKSRLVFIVQGKYHQHSEPTASRSDVLALADLGRALMNESRQIFDSVLKNSHGGVNTALTEARVALHRKGYGLVLEFVTTGKISKTHLEEAEERISEWSNVRFDSYARIDLMKLMQDYLEGAAPPTPTVSIPICGPEVFSRHDEDTGITSWIFSVSGNEIAQIFNDIGIRLFARNIRGYLGNTEINKVMMTTLEEEPEFFWYYNNGITITCDKARQIRKGGSNVIQVTNAQIINGQQTTRTLAQVRNNKAEVLVKLIEVTRNNDKDQRRFAHVVTSIVSATNWQNAISQSDLKSNDPEQVRIEKEMKKYGYWYIRKRMKKSEASKYGGDRYSFKINKEELARFLAAVNVDPYEIRLGKDRLFEDDIYSKIFDGRNVSEYLTIYWLGKYLTYWVKDNNKYSYAKWIVLNFLWNELGQDLRKIVYKEPFRKICERPSKFYKEVKLLDDISKLGLRMSLRFYILNKKVEGRVQEPIDFFKHVKYHLRFRDDVKKHQKRRIKRMENLRKKFLLGLENVEY